MRHLVLIDIEGMNFTVVEEFLGIHSLTCYGNEVTYYYSYLCIITHRDVLLETKDENTYAMNDQPTLYLKQCTVFPLIGAGPQIGAGPLIAAGGQGT